MFLQALLLIFSMIILFFGASMALEAAERIGKCLGLSSLVIGSLIIGFGTSLPEFFVSQLACIRGHNEIALGNIIGSNIANLLLVLGVAGIMVPLRTNHISVQKQFIIHLLLTLLLVGVVGYFPKLYPLSALALFLFFGYYIFDTLKEMKRSHKLLENDDSHVAHSVTANKRYRTLKIMTVIKLFAGFAFLYFGGELLISSGSKVALEMGVSEYVISAIFIAFGTSFPELVTAIVACVKKKEIDLIIGNVIGSNVFNAAFVLGGLGFYEVVFKHSFLMELGALLLVSILLLGLALFKKVFYRPIGIIFLALYSAMIVYWVN